MAAPAETDKVTVALARHLAGFRYEDRPAEVVGAARRGVLDWLGCALAGSRHSTLDILVSTMHELDMQSGFKLIGRNDQSGLLSAALINGAASLDEAAAAVLA